MVRMHSTLAYHRAQRHIWLDLRDKLHEPKPQWQGHSFRRAPLPVPRSRGLKPTKECLDIDYLLIPVIIGLVILCVGVGFLFSHLPALSAHPPVVSGIENDLVFSHGFRKDVFSYVLSLIGTALVVIGCAITASGSLLQGIAFLSAALALALYRVLFIGPGL